MAQSWSRAMSPVSGAESARSGGSSRNSILPPPREILLDHLDLGREEVGLRSRHDQHGGIGRHLLLLREHQLLDRVVVRTKRGLDGAVARPVRDVDVVLAVALDEVDLVLLPWTTLTNPLTNSCSPSDETRSTRPSYSMTTVPSASTLYWLASDGRRTASMYSIETCDDAYLNSSSRSRKRANSSDVANTLMLTGLSRLCSTLRVCSESVYCFADVRSQRLLWRAAR